LSQLLSFGGGMKKYALIFLMYILVFHVGESSAEVPYQVGPFVLNHPITEFEKFVSMETDLPVRYMEYVHEAEIKPIKGFKSGLIAYTTCEKPGRLVRIKLKYADDSRKFYDNLMKRVESRFGKSDEYRGDPFHIVIAWKWSFVDKDKNRISLTLQHNTRDEEEKMGNSIKLTLASQIEEYKSCFEEKLEQTRGEQSGTPREIEIPGLSGWDLFVPR
jgi:hypothetical protein